MSLLIGEMAQQSCRPNPMAFSKWQSAGGREDAEFAFVLSTSDCQGIFLKLAMTAYLVVYIMIYQMLLNNQMSSRRILSPRCLVELGDKRIS
jgi:hypothetical protein